ncbi:MAG: hypothetical protein ABI461_01545 [Polyangiaceae bacterium]
MNNEIRSRVAHHLVGDNRYFGNSINDLVGHETYSGMIALALTGRRATEEQRQTLDDVAVILTSADPRIWPLKLTRLISSYGSTMAGFTASQLALEGNQIGPWVIGYSAAMLVTLDESVGDTQGDPLVLEERIRDFVARTPRFFGYGVPLRKSDERLDRLETRMRERGRDHLHYWQLHLALAREIMRVKGLPPNVGAGLAAVFLDHGYSPREASTLPMFLHQNVFAANANEAATQAEAGMRTLPAEAIDYVGQPARISPRALAVENAMRKDAENSIVATS